jgi:hypothetical protein
VNIDELSAEYSDFETLQKRDTLHAKPLKSYAKPDYPEKLRVRCPSCTKLFVVNTFEIKSSCPHFQCVVCHTKFTFNFPPSDFNAVQARSLSIAPLVETNKAPVEMDLESTKRVDDSLFQTSDEPSTHDLTSSVRKPSLSTKKVIKAVDNKNLKSCPKCGALNSMANKECYSCSVIFDRVAAVSSDAGVRTLPSLVRKWQEVLSDFENINLHRKFIQACRDAEALTYAIYRYQQLQEVQPQDKIVQQMLAEAMAFKPTKKESPLPGFGLGLKSIEWGRVLYWLPPVVALPLLLLGFSNLGLRNLIGFAFSIIVLWAGLSLFLTGRIGYQQEEAE